MDKDSNEIKTADYFQGRHDATEDINRSVFKFKVYGRLGEWSLAYYQILKQEYQVEMERVAGCMITDDIAHYARGYNDTMTAELKKRFGNDIFDNVSSLVKKILEYGK